MSIPVFKPSIKRREMNAVLNCLVSEEIGPGKENAAFSKEMAQYFSCSSGMLLKEYTRSIELALTALGVGEGSEVILTPLEHRCYLSVIQVLGATPVFVDVEEDSVTISPGEAEKHITENTACIIASTHLGFVPDLDSLVELNCPILEDVSEGFGANTGSQVVGSYGRIVIHRFTPDAILSCGSGCGIFAKKRKEGSLVKKLISEAGDDILLPDMNAVMGPIQLKDAEKNLERRKEIAQVFLSALFKSHHKAISQKRDAENTCYFFPVVVKHGMKDVIQYAAKKQVQAVPAFANSIIAFHDNDEFECPFAFQISSRCLLFPLYPLIGKKGISQIEKVLSTLP
ncbi:MAG: DegT/DnrJ/EryC1/StrS family aminotransferase [Spirochaetia bacterium]